MFVFGREKEEFLVEDLTRFFLFLIMEKTGSFWAVKFKRLVVGVFRAV